MRVRRFEDLIAWQKARALVRDVYRATEKRTVYPDYPFVDQLRASAVSAMANIAEGFERGSATEFCRFLTIAKASCAELRSHLYVGLDVGAITDAEFAHLLSLAEEVARIIGGLRASVARRRA